MNAHGGNVYIYENKNIIDYSSNINPFGVPQSFKEGIKDKLEWFTRYPDINYTDLRNSIAEYLGNCDIDNIIVGNGAVELIYKAIGAIHYKRVYTLSPTFSEYRRAANQYKSKVKEIHCLSEDYLTVDTNLLLEQIEPKSIVVLCNPNNPTGTLIPSNHLLHILIQLKDRNCYLIVDEAFMEFTDTYPLNSMLPYTREYTNLIVIKAATKFFGMPGIRLGYAATSNPLIKNRIMEQLEPWHVNTAAVIAGEYIFKDVDYIRQTKEWIHKERAFMYKELSGIEGLTVFPSSVNYHLIRSNRASLNAQAIKVSCLKRDLLIRTPEGFNNLSPYHFRLAVKDHENNKIMIDVLKTIFENSDYII